jgi:hypothetical protein
MIQINTGGGVSRRVGMRPAFAVILGLDPMRAKKACRTPLIVMVRLDRTIGCPKHVLTGLLRQMVRSEPDHDVINGSCAG